MVCGLLFMNYYYSEKKPVRRAEHIVKRDKATPVIGRGGP
jgi:hypothetical protein